MDYKDNLKQVIGLYDDIVTKQYQMDELIEKSLIDIVKNNYNRTEERVTWGHYKETYNYVDIDADEDISYDGRLWKLKYIAINEEDSIEIGFTRYSDNIIYKEQFYEIETSSQITILELSIKYVEKINKDKENN